MPPPSPRTEQSLSQKNVPEKKRSSGASVVLLLLLVGGGVAVYKYHQAKSEREQDFSPTQTSYTPVASETASDNRKAYAGQTVVSEFQTLKDGQYVTYRIPSGHYRVRVTANRNGIKAKWIGVSCFASAREERVYEATCDPSAEAQFVVENPTRLGLGDSEQVSINVVTK